MNLAQTKVEFINSYINSEFGKAWLDYEFYTSLTASILFGILVVACLYFAVLYERKYKNNEWNDNLVGVGIAGIIIAGAVFIIQTLNVVSILTSPSNAMTNHAIQLWNEFSRAAPYWM
jgi:energy-coupling factor transporter transmembrane protein EcfT